MKLENENLVGESQPKMLDHIFLCHDKIKKLKAILEEYGDPKNYYEHIEYPHYVINGKSELIYNCADIGPELAKESLKED